MDYAKEHRFQFRVGDLDLHNDGIFSERDNNPKGEQQCLIWQSLKEHSNIGSGSSRGKNWNGAPSQLIYVVNGLQTNASNK